VDDRGGTKEVPPSLPIKIAVEEDVREGIAATTVWAGGDVSSSGPEVIRIVGVKGMASDELETRRLEGSRLCKEDALGEGREHRGRVVVESGVKTTRVTAQKLGAIHHPFREHAVSGGERRGPRDRKVGGLFLEGVNPVRLARPCPSLGELLPCNKDVRYLENVHEDVKKGRG